MKKISVKTFYLIAVISIGLIGLAVGSTYAMFTTSAEISNPITLSSNLTSNNDVMETFELQVDPKKALTKTIIINSGNNTNVKYGIWYLNNITDVEVGVKSTTNNETSGTIASANTSRTIEIVVKNNSTESKTVTIGIATSKSDIVLASNMGLVPKTVVDTSVTLSSYITSLYDSATKTTVTNNSITYQYDATNNIMKDIGGNLRYYGASPNNYIYFNCSDYSNQSSSTCEVWRIIGVFDDKVKIVRESSIGAYSWDNKTDGVWSTSSSMKILNPNFTGTNGSTYWNGVSGTCNNGNNTTGTCDFTTSGLKAGTTKSLISNSTWNIGSTTEDYVNVEYNKEIKTTGSFYVGLPNVSDYGYAADLGKCAKQLRNYSDSTCTSNNWMIFLSKGTKKMASLINNYDSNMINIVNESGNVDIFNNDYDDASPLYSYNMFPTLYLTSDAIVDESTKGSSSNPYKIKSPTK